MLGGLPPHRAPLGRLDPEALQLRARGRLAGAPVHAPVGDEVEGRQALGDPGGMVVARRHQDDAVPETDPSGTLRGRGQEDLGRRGVGIFLQEVVLDLPRVVDAQPIGQLDLGQRVLEELLLATRSPGPRQLVLVEDPESHARSFRAHGMAGVRPS